MTQSTRELDPRDARLSHHASRAAGDLKGYQGKRRFATLNNRHRGGTLSTMSAREAPVHRVACPPLPEAVEEIATDGVDRAAVREVLKRIPAATHPPYAHHPYLR